MISPPLVPAKIFPPCSVKAISLMLFDLIFPKTFYKEIYLYLLIFALQIIILPAASPEIIPPSVLSQRAPTDLLCYLNTLFAKLPFHCTNKPLVIDVTIESPRVAIARFGLRGALPKTPFLVYNLPAWKRQKTTYF
jgi:hypothetical protein